MDLVLLVALYAGSAVAIRLAAGGIGPRIPARAALLLALLPLPFVGGGFLPGKVLAPTNALAGNAPWCAPELVDSARRGSTAENPLLFDPLSQGEPWRRASRDGILFNPSAGSGAALLGNAQSAPLFLPELLGRLLSPARAASWIQAARLLIAVFGAFLLARTLGLRRDAALVAAAAFVSAGFLQLWRAHALSSVAAMTPWILAAVVRLVRRPSRRAAVALGIVGAVAVSAGHPETLLQSAILTLFAAAPALVLALATPRRRLRGLRAIGWGAVAACLAALLSAPVLLPFLETMRASESWAMRDAGFLPPVEEPLRPALGRLATAVQLLVRGDPVSGTFRGASNLAESGGGAMGAATLVLAGAALGVRGRRRFVLGWLALGMAGLLVSSHIPFVARAALLVPWLGHSILDRLGLWWVVAASVLAGLGSTALARPQGRRWAAGAAVGLAALLAILAVSVPLARLPTALGIELAGLAGAAAVVALGRRLPQAARVAVLVLAVVAPRAAFFSTWVPVSPVETFYPETPAVRFVKERAAGYRVAGFGTGLWPASAAFFGLEDPRIYDPMTFIDYAQLLSWIGRPRVAAWQVIEEGTSPALTFLGVRYLFDTPGAPERPPLSEVYRGSDATVFENRAALPRAFVPRRIVAARNAPAAAEATRALTDPAGTAILTTEAWPEGELRPNGDAELLELDVKRGRISFRAAVRSRVLVATSQPAIPGWRVEVDGRPVRPERVDTAFLAVWLEPGERHVTMRYAPWTFPAGLVLLGAGILLAVGFSTWNAARGARLMPWVARRAAPAAIAAALVAASLWLPAGLPLVALADFVHDDALYVKLGAHLARSEWLGPYDESTLAKGPGFPLFVAISYLAGVPLLLAGRLLFAVSCGLFVLALLPLFRGRGVPLLLFAALLFNPVVVTRAAREVIYPSLTLFALAGAAGLFLSFPSSRPRAAAWATLCGLGLGALWLTREEGIWIVPAVGSLLAATVVRTAITDGRTRRLGEAAFLAALPAGILGAGLLAVAFLNHRAYGVFSVRESLSEPFLSAFGSLARIRSRMPIPRVLVPREMRLRAYAESPALRTLEPYLEGEVGRGFIGASDALVPEGRGELSGGGLQFALREAAARTGRYRDARTAAAFWKRVASELDEACDSGRLPCGPNPRSLTPPGAVSQVPAVLADLPRSLAFLVASVDSAPALRDPGSSRGPKGGRVVFARTTRERLAPAPDEPRWVRVHGWAFLREGGPVDWRVRGPDGASVPYGVRRLPSGDVAASLGAPEARDARVELQASCPGPCVVELLDSGRPLVAFDPVSPGERIGTPPPALAMCVGAVEVVSPPAEPGDYERDEKRWGALRRIAGAYRRILMPGLPVAVALFVLVAVVAVLRRRGVLAVVVAGALLCAVVSRVVILDLVDRTSFPALHYLYLAPAYPLLYAFVVLAVVSAAGSLRGAPAVERLSSYLWAKAATFGFTSRSKSA